MKSVDRSKLNRWTRAAAIGSAILLPVFAASAAQQVGAPGKQWTVKYHAGAAPFLPESQIVVAIEGEQIILRPKKGPEFSIAAGTITAVSSSTKGHYGAVSRAEAKFVETYGNSDCFAFYPCTTAVIIADLLIIPSYPIKTTERLVQIVWRDRNLDEEIVLKVHKNDFDPFLAQLEKATAKPWESRDMEWAKVQQELKNAESSKVQIRLDQKVRIAKSDLEPGPYQIVLLEREPSQGELYFFPGTEVDPEHLAAVALVEIMPLETGSDSIEVSYKQDSNGKTAISRIQTQSRILRFP